MKTNEYIHKYRLKDSKTKGFSYRLFVQDLFSEFLAVLELHRERVSDFNYIHYEQCVSEIERKFDSIQNKSHIEIPDFLWDRLYDNVIISVRYKLFPEILDWEEKFEGYSFEGLMDEVRGIYPNKGGLSKYSYSGISNLLKRLQKTLSTLLDNEPVHRYHNITLIDITLKKLSRHITMSEKKEAEEDRRWRENRQKSRNDWRSAFGGFINDDFYSYVFGTFFERSKIKPETELQVLGLNGGDYTSEDIKKAYREKAMKMHPDKGGKQEDFIQLTEAKNKCLAWVKSKLDISYH